MKVMTAEWSARLLHWIRLLKEELYEPLGEIAWQAHRTKEHICLEEALAGRFEEVSPGFTWGETWEYCWFRGSVVLPEQAKGKRIVLHLVPDGESTLFVNGKSFGTYRSQQVAPLRDMLENVTEELSLEKGSISIKMNIFEIKSIRIVCMR